MAVFKVSVDLPNVGEGTEVEVPGLGLFENGSSRLLTEKDVQTFEIIHGHGLEEANFQEGITVEEGEEEGGDEE